MSIKPPETVWLKLTRVADQLPFLSSPPVLKVLPETIHPLIVVPGFLGSWPSAFSLAGGKLDPITGVYTGLIEGLRRIGYVPGISLFPFPYDWRLGVEDTGVQLGQEIQAIRRLSPLAVTKHSSVNVDYSKVDILAHSMGGLVSRAYVQSNAYAEDVRRLILCATPNKGAVAAYYGYEGGETSYIGVPTASAKIMVGLMEARTFRNPLTRVRLTVQAARGQADYDLQQYLSQQTASVRDLLPLGRTNYLYCLNEAGEEQVYPYGSRPGYPVNASIEKLDDPEQLARLDKVEEIRVFYSNSQRTRRRVLVQDRYAQSQPLYEHGYPVDPQPPESFGPGDTIVTEESAKLDLPETKPDGSDWRVKVVHKEVSGPTGQGVDHVQLVGDPSPIRYLLDYLTADGAEPLTVEHWDCLPVLKRKPNYLALFI